MATRRATRVGGLALLLAGVAALGVGSSRPATETPVAAADTSAGNPLAPRCGALTVGGLEVSGGCEAPGLSQRTTFDARTPVGNVWVGTCSFALTLHVGRDGAVAIDEVVVTGGEGPCGDIGSCARNPAVVTPEGLMPWSGRIRRGPGGRLAVAVDACFDTCVGRFEGRLVLDLVRRGSLWAMRASEAPVGQSGFALTGEWLFEGDALGLGAASDEDEAGDAGRERS